MNSPIIFSEAWVQALGWTLVHSLWQGAAIALILWFLLPRLSQANQRYWISYGALSTVLFAAIGTFIWVYSSRQTPAVPGNSETTAFAEYFPEAAVQAMPAAEPGFWANLTSTLEPYQPLIVSIWLLGFCFFLFQLLTGVGYLYRLRRRQNQPLAPEWQERLQALASKIGLTRPVGLLESALVKAPMALGYFKPLILLPVGMANQLAPAEVEAILAHELAHIARRDWLFNLLQAFIEALFYFHPAVWWMAATIRAERENCCDDTAVALTGNRLAYAKTLVHLQDLARSAAAPGLALGIDGSPNLLRRRPLLLERIKRILQQPQQSASLMEKTIALAILVALITFFTVRANTPPAFVESIREIAEKPITWFAQAPQAEPAWQVATDTVPPQPAKRQRIVREDDDQTVEMELENGKITELKIDGKVIDAKDYDQYKSLTDKLRDEAVTPPAPPTPPTPPAPPSAPHGIWAAPRHPNAPFPARSSSRISTETDDNGNTIIRVERNGEPLEIRVKDGEVWIGDEKIEEGDVMDIETQTDAPYLFWQDGEHQFRIEGNHLQFIRPDGGVLEVPQPLEAPHYFHFDQGNNQFFFKGENGAVFAIPELRYDEAELKRMQEDIHIQTEARRKEIEKELKAYEKEMRKNRKDWEKNSKERQQALEDAQRNLEKARREQEEALARVRQAQREARTNLRSAQHDYQRAQHYQKQAGSFSSTVMDALLKDKLIDNPDNYTFDLSKKEMRVNGKKQPDAVHEKYLAIYRKHAGKDIGEDKIRIRVKN